MPQKIRVMVGLSGGVDSSIAALLLQEQGYEVEGLFMKNWDEDDGEAYCTAEADLADAQSVCDRLGIPLHTVSFARTYWDQVFEHFLTEYQAGRTPNPDILCNREIKFKAFLDYALSLGADKIATGHYAQISAQDGEFHLMKSSDRNKDQTYFLYTLGQRALSHSLFPIGHLQKKAVRTLAEKHDLITHNKKDSTGICFIGERQFKDFLSRYLPAKHGHIKTTEGQIIGEHEGLMYYTLGQRKGIGVGGLKESGEEPWYVLKKELSTNTLIIGQGHDHPLLFSQMLVCEDLSFISGHPVAQQFTCHAKIRYRQVDQACRVIMKDDQRAEIIFDTPQRAVTPGQSVVFYQNDSCLGGGVIAYTHSS